MKDFSGIEFASEHNGTDVFRLIELAYEQGRKDGHNEQLGTNLAEDGTDCSEFPNSSDTISRQAAIDALDKRFDNIPMEQTTEILQLRKDLRQLPSAQPEIIRCRECKFASGDSRICMKFDHSPIGELDFCSFAERREVTT